MPAGLNQLYMQDGCFHSIIQHSTTQITTEIRAINENSAKICNNAKKVELYAFAYANMQTHNNPMSIYGHVSRFKKGS